MWRSCQRRFWVSVCSGSDPGINEWKAPKARSTLLIQKPWPMNIEGLVYNLNLDSGRMVDKSWLDVIHTHVLGHLSPWSMVIDERDNSKISWQVFCMLRLAECSRREMQLSSIYLWDDPFAITSSSGTLSLVTSLVPIFLPNEPMCPRNRQA